MWNKQSLKRKRNQNLQYWEIGRAGVQIIVSLYFCLIGFSMWRWCGVAWEPGLHRTLKYLCFLRSLRYDNNIHKWWWVLEWPEEACYSFVNILFLRVFSCMGMKRQNSTETSLKVSPSKLQLVQNTPLLTLLVIPEHWQRKNRGFSVFPRHMSIFS